MCVGCGCWEVAGGAARFTKSDLFAPPTRAAKPTWIVRVYQHNPYLIGPSPAPDAEPELVQTFPGPHTHHPDTHDEDEEEGGPSSGDISSTTPPDDGSTVPSHGAPRDVPSYLTRNPTAFGYLPVPAAPRGFLPGEAHVEQPPPYLMPEPLACAPAPPHTKSKIMCCYHKQGKCKMGADCWYSHEGDIGTPCHYGAKCKAGHRSLIKSRGEQKKPQRTAALMPTAMPCLKCGAAGAVRTQEFPIYIGGTMTTATRAHCLLCLETYAL